MTKNQLKVAVLNTAVSHKAGKKFLSELTVLMEEFAQNANRDTVKRDKVLTIDGETYIWCNRHEVYEPKMNFKTETSPECKLGHKHWTNLSKQVKDLTDQLMAKAVAGEDVKDIAKELEDTKAIRGGRFDFDANALQYPDLENYDYDSDNFVKEDDIPAS